MAGTYAKTRFALWPGHDELERHDDDWFTTRTSSRAHGTISASCPGSVPGIHVFAALMGGKDVDGRDQRPGHDAERMVPHTKQEPRGIVEAV
jgi:hypothetical protein